MTSLLALLALGFFLGMRHATDADHVIAVTTIVARHRRVASAAWVGAVWGLGHTLTIAIVGTGIIALGWVIPPRVGLSMEFSVAVMLIVLGAMNLTGVLRKIQEAVGGSPARRSDGYVHSHAHSHGDYVHTHVHAHEPDSHPHRADQTPVGWLDRHLGMFGAYQLVRPFVVGIVHGLAGSAAVALLVLATIRDPAWSILYLLVFGVGTIAGMMLVTLAISVPLTFTQTRFATLNRRFRIVSGLVSVAFGIFLAYEIGIVDGLFTGDSKLSPP